MGHINFPACFGLVFLPLIALAQDHNPHVAHRDHMAHMEMAAEPPANLHGVTVDFELVKASGDTATLKDYKGKHLLLGFGFTHCEYVCPTMAANIAKAIRSAKNPVAGVFISVDTERDTPAITHNYAQGFHEAISGLSGSYAQVAKAATNFKVTFAVTKTPQSYTVQHTATIFLISPDGILVDVFALNATADEIVAAINAWQAG